MVLLLKILDLGAELASSVLLSVLLLHNHLAYGLVSRLQVLLELRYLFSKPLIAFKMRFLVISSLLLREGKLTLEFKHQSLSLDLRFPTLCISLPQSLLRLIALLSLAHLYLLYEALQVLNLPLQGLL